MNSILVDTNVLNRSQTTSGATMVKNMTLTNKGLLALIEQLKGLLVEHARPYQTEIKRADNDLQSAAVALATASESVSAAQKAKESLEQFKKSATLDTRTLEEEAETKLQTALAQMEQANAAFNQANAKFEEACRPIQIWRDLVNHAQNVRLDFVIEEASVSNRLSEYRAADLRREEHERAEASVCRYCNGSDRYYCKHCDPTR